MEKAVTYGTSTDDIHLTGEQIDNLALPFIAPLGPEDADHLAPGTIIHLEDSSTSTHACHLALSNAHCSGLKCKNK